MKQGVFAAVCIAAFIFCSAQTPAPTTSPVALPVKPLRHLEYSFGVSYLATGEGHVEMLGSGAGAGSSSGVVNYDQTNGRQGTLDVDILAAANDGGLVVRAQEQVQHREHQFPPVTCAVYGDGRVLCGNDPHANVPTDVMTTVFSKLGRGFYDPTQIDDKGAWQRRVDAKGVVVVDNFASLPHAGGKPVELREHRTIKSTDGVKDDYTEDTQITYDPAMSVPDRISEDAVTASRSAAYLRSKINVTLISDSFAKH